MDERAARDVDEVISDFLQQGRPEGDRLERQGSVYGAHYLVDVLWQDPIEPGSAFDPTGYAWNVVRTDADGTRTRFYAKRGVVRRNGTGDLTEHDGDAVMQLLTGRARR
jgi:hypothetical protein